MEFKNLAYRAEYSLGKKQISFWLIILIVFLSFILIPVSIVAQQNYIRFNHLTRDNGLSSNRINFIAEDSLGFIWFATEEGLDRFDGYEIKNFTKFFPEEKGYSDYATNYILEDIKKPNLWIATRKGLVYFDRKNNTFHLTVKPFNPSSSGIKNITTLCFDSKQNIWIGTLNGLYSWNNNKHQLITLVAPNQKQYSRINTLYKDNNGKMWVGSDSGLFCFKEKDSTFTRYYSNRFKYITLVKQDSLNHFIVGSKNSGLFFLDNSSEMKIIRHLAKENGYFANNRVADVIPVSHDLYYILIRDGGLYVYNYLTNKIKYFAYDIHNPDGMNSTALISGLKSSQGIIWIGTYNSGINYYDNMQKKFMLFKVNFKKDGLFNNNVRALAEDSDGYIWVGTKERGGLSRFDKTKGTFLNYKKSNKKDGLRDDFVFSICDINRKKLLVGTFRAGLAEFDKKTQKFKYFTHKPSQPNSLFDNRVYLIYKDKENKIWIGNYVNLQLFNLKKRTFYTMPNILRPRCICEEDKNHLWIGSQNYGIYLFDKKSKTFVRYYHHANDTNSLICNDIYAIVKDKHGNIWIGTKQGLDKMNIRTKQFTHYTKKNGLASNWIRALQIDQQDNIWVSTSNGISKFEMKDHRIHNYDISDNLQGNEFERYVSLKTHDGFILFGGHNGFNIFKPEQIIDNKQIPPVYIKEIQTLNKKYLRGEKASLLNRNLLFSKKITLNHNQSEFTIRFLALNYTSPFKNQYAYRLEGFDQNWIYTGNVRSAVFTNIPPGDYIFHVKASNNDNYWNEQGDSLEIVILPPFWQTAWAYIIYGITFLFLFLLLRKIISVRIQQKNLLEFERLDKKRIQEINHMKLQFFTNISHEFRTPLTLISSPLEQLINYNTTTEKQQKYYLTIIKHNVDRLLFLVNELMDFRKSEQGRLKLHISQNDIVLNVKENIACFELKMKKKNISVSFNQEVESPMVWFDESIINKIIFNLLSNAVKFTNKNGLININLKIKDGIAQFSITNSGTGIPTKDLPHIFERFYQLEDNYLGHTGTGIGLTFSKRLIETHKGAIKVTSQLNKSTTFSITFPIKYEVYKDEIIIEKKRQTTEFYPTISSLQ